jgi:hypothetical protein
VFANKHALALAHASGGGKCKRRVPYRRNGVERRSEAEVCTSEARKIRVPLARARGGASQEGLVSLLGAERMRSHFVVAVAMGRQLSGRKHPSRYLVDSLSRFTLTQHDAESTGNAGIPGHGPNLTDGLGHQSLAARSGLST